MNLAEIYDALEYLTVDELRNLNEAVIHTVKAKRQQQASIKKLSLSVGDKVEWTGKNGHTTGTIIKINRTRCKVKQADSFTTWTIPINMLSKCEPAFNPATRAWE